MTATAGPRVTQPAELGLRADRPMPLGIAIDLDPDTRQLAADVLFGGSPARVLRLSPAGVRALAELRAGYVTSAAGALLARRLTDTGMAHPRPAGDGGAPTAGLGQTGPGAAGPGAPGLDAGGLDAGGLDAGGLDAGGLDVTVVVPVRDRAPELDRCLAAAGAAYPLVVVDDGSVDPASVASVCVARGARLVRRDVSGGPGPARNTALAMVGTEFVAFLDSDCVPPRGWIDSLAGHFADPLVAAVAPRIVAVRAAPAVPVVPAVPSSPSEPSRPSDLSDPSDPSRSSGPSGPSGPFGASGRTRPAPGGGATLDLGDRPARVAPMTRVAYVPTAALVVRRAAIGGGFDEALRYGEDVDLIWRLIDAGWRVRYDPRVEVPHAEPASRRALLRRRFHYGTSAAPLTRRHPGAVAPLVLQPGPAITMAALLARRPVTAGVVFGVSTALVARRLRAGGLPARGLVRPMGDGVRLTWLGTGRWCGEFAGPAVLAVMAFPGGRTARTRWGRRLAAASLLAGPPLAEWARRRDANPLRLIAVTLADQAAYGAGVYVGCARERLLTPALPSIAWPPFEGLRTGRTQSPQPP